jgi:hypothetical protein
VCRVNDLFRFSAQLVLEIFLAPTSNQRVTVKIREEMHVGLRVKCPFVCLFVCVVCLSV